MHAARRLGFFACLVVLAGLAGAREVQSDWASFPPGGYSWRPEIAPAGPVVVVVSLDEQRTYVYRNGIAIGIAEISSGRRGHETPPGIYTILEKDRDHRSNRYDNAPMPYMERLTWDGVALHGGELPGYPASHGCIRLPGGFAQKLFAITQRGQTVVVADSAASPFSVVHPTVLAPVSAHGETLADWPDSDATWDDTVAPDGPVAIVASIADRRVYVMRNGVRVGTASLRVATGFSLVGSLLLVVGDGYEDAPSSLDPRYRRHRWNAFSIGSNASSSASIGELSRQLSVSEPFARRIYAALVPGTTVLVTERPAARQAQNPPRPVLEADGT